MKIIVWLTESTWPACVDAATDYPEAQVVLLHVIDLPVGQNLKDHLAVLIMFARTEGSEFRNNMRLDKMALNMMRAWMFGTGPATVVPGGLHAFIKTRPELVPSSRTRVWPIRGDASFATRVGGTASSTRQQAISSISLDLPSAEETLSLEVLECPPVHDVAFSILDLLHRLDRTGVLFTVLLQSFGHWGREGSLRQLKA